MNRLDFEVLRLDFGRIRSRIWPKNTGWEGGISYKPLVGISPNLQLGRMWDKDELITF